MEENPFVEWVDEFAPSGKPKTFFVPDDGVLKGIYKKFETDREAFTRIPPDLAKAFVSLWDKDNFKTNGVKLVGKKVDGISFSEERTRYHTYQYIRGFISKPELSQQLKEFLTTKYDFSTEYKDVLQQIAKGHLKGKDLIAFCLSNTKINTFCNQKDQALFKSAILKEFNIDWNMKNYGMRPRDLYINLHKGFFRVVAIDDKSTYAVVSGTQRLGKNNRQVATILATPTQQIGTKRYIFFFPEIPELSFYAETKSVKNTRSELVIGLFDRAPRRKTVTRQELQVTSLQDTEVIETHISRAVITALVLEYVIYPDLIAFRAVGNSAWYAELTGDPTSQIHIFKV